MQPGTTLIKSQQRAEVTSDEMIILEKHPLKITEKISEKKTFPTEISAVRKISTTSRSPMEAAEKNFSCSLQGSSDAVVGGTRVETFPI